MATFKRFEDIQAWQKAREVASSVYRVTKNGHFAKDFGLRDQIRRASVSIMANIAEGFARRTDKDFAYFLNISRSSAAVRHPRRLRVRDRAGGRAGQIQAG